MITSLMELICERVIDRHEAKAVNHVAAVRAFEDTAAVIFAGSFEPVSRFARQYVVGTASALLGGGSASSSELAAFAHATAGHALDYDDVHLVSITHPSVVIVPALLAIADQGYSPQAMLDAYGVGVSVNIALGHVFGFEHYSRGWHATSTIGPIAAAAAICSYLSCNERETRNAIALAAAQAGGLQRNFGSMAKPVQAGNAAAAAVRAALMAGAGVTGDSDIFGRAGFLDLYGSSAGRVPAMSADDVQSISVKLFPCCYATHRLIAAVLDARGTLGIAGLRGIDRVEIRVPFETMKPLRAIDPKTGNEAKFCATYVAAVALLFGGVTLDDFNDDAIRRPLVRSTMGYISVSDDAASGRKAVGLEFGAVEVRLWTGQLLAAESTCTVFPGSPEAPATSRQFEAKLSDCAATYAKFSGKTTTANDIRRRLFNAMGGKASGATSVSSPECQ